MSSTLDSDSTFIEVKAAYRDNASYREDSSRAKALAFITACISLADLTPMSTSRDGQSTTKESLLEQQHKAEAWLIANPASTGSGSTRVRYGDFQDFRD